ncbi:divalent-cation tolerance protein CutA [Methylocystis iwaonis]|uniref:divalent-cation tolerance protein CutA n=1 Tax=Methylocystis iwaonis TaxID=2885079 RepID=UPI002E7C3ED9|nr:divalent cation tolerance protein CutA [Methylocystis iwaonis]
MSGVSILVTTIDSHEKARALAHAALAEKLAACVQITPISSLYTWKGACCEESEFRIEMKHRTEDYAALAALVRRLHSYETPEILRVDAADTEPAYAAWLRESTQRG